MNITTIIICRNSRETINKCLQSVLNQTVKATEIIVVDGNSTDGTSDFLKTKPGIKIIYQKEQGIANARNIGIQQAQGEFIAFLDADDYWLKNSLELRMEQLIKDISCIAVGGHLQKSDDLNTLFPAYTPGGFVFRKEAFQSVGMFNESWKYAADHEWFKRMMQGNFNFQMLNSLVMIKGMHDSNTSLIHKEAYRKEMMQVLRTTNTK